MTRIRFSLFAAAILFCPLPDALNRTRIRRIRSKQLPFAGVKMKLQVVDDPEMAKAIERLRGEWNAQSGSDFEIVQSGEKEFSEAENLSADAVICPSRPLALLAEKKLLAELPEKIQQCADWSEVFELPKLREAAWAGKIYGLSFGSPVLTIYYRADLLKKLDRTPPKTWANIKKSPNCWRPKKNRRPSRLGTEPWNPSLPAGPA